MADNKKNVRFAKSLEEQQMKVAPDQINMAAKLRKPEDLEDVAPRTPGVMDEQFPTDALTAYDKRDKLMNAKLALQEGSEPGYTPFGKLIAKDEDFKWLQKKQVAAEMANFQQWFAREFDLMSPAQKKRAKELYPEFYAQRRKLVKKQAKLLADYAMLKLDGVENFEDLKKVYMVETGRVDLGPMQNLLHPEGVNAADGSNALNQARFKRGLANPFTVFGKEAIPENIKTRKQEQQNFAARDYNSAVTSKLGARTGFPPFNSDQTNQSDAAWYKVLADGIRGL